MRFALSKEVTKSRIEIPVPEKAVAAPFLWVLGLLSVKMRAHRCLCAVLFVWVANMMTAEFATAQVTAGTATYGVLNNASSTTISYTNASGANKILMVGISAQQPAASVSSVTYNGVALTKLGNLSNSNQGRIEIWYLKSPAVGTYNVVVTNSQSDNGIVGVMSFSGVEQTTPFGTLATASGSGTSASVTATSASNELVYSVVAFNNGSTNQTPGSGQTEYWDQTMNSSIAGAGSTKAGAASVTMSWTSTSASWTIGAVSLKPAVTGQTTVALTAIADNELYLASVTSNYGACNPLYIGNVGNSRALLKFNLSGIPAGSTIISATLSLNKTGGPGQSAEIRRVTSGDWTEGSGACGGTTAASSWNQRIAGTNWTTAGGDFDANVEATTTTGSVNGVYNWNIQSLVHNWVNGVYPNYGLLIKSVDESTTSECTYSSREDATASNRPMLTITYSPPSPGGISTNLALWLKADAGTDVTTDGAAVNTWTNAAPSGDISTAAVGFRPLYRISSSNFNFNPLLDFGGDDDYFTTPGNFGVAGTNLFTTFAVTRRATDNTSDMIFGGSASAANSFGFMIHSNDLGLIEAQTIGTKSGSNATALAGVGNIKGLVRSASNTWQLYHNGAADGVSGSISGFGGTLNTSNLNIAAGEGTQAPFDGDIAEIIIHSGALTSTDISKINSYLAIKYGITLDQAAPQNYVNSAGTVIWNASTNATYKENITAIGRDDNSGLNQKQSKSVNTSSALVTIGNGNTVAASNAANTNNFSANNSFLIFGDDAGAITSWQTSEAPTARQRLAREWKVQETGTVGSVKIQVPDNGSSLAVKLPTEGVAVYLLVDADGNFSSGATEIAMTLNGTNWEANVDFTNGQYFTFATSCTFSLTGTQTNVTTCFGATTGTINITASGGTSPYIYDWQDIAGTSNAEDRSALAAGVYTVTTSDANGCTAAATFTITQPAGLSLTTVVTHEIPVGSATGAIDLSVSGGTSPYTYDWADVAGTSNPQDRSAISGGTYTVTVTDNAGCTASTTVTVNAIASVTKQLYLSDPSQALDRTDPVASADGTTAMTAYMSPTAPGVAIESSSTGSSANPNSTTFTVSHTTGSGLNRLMLVGISQKNKTVSSVTYGGTPLTLVGEVITNANARMHLYRLINPPTGTANVVVTLNANPDKGIIVGVTTFTGVDQTTPLGTFAGATGLSSAPSVSVSSAAGEMVYDVVALRNANLTVGAGQTQRWNIASGGEMRGGSSTESGASSTTMSWSGSSSQDWAIGAVSVKPAAAVTSTTFTQSPVLCSGLTLPAGGTVSAKAYVSSYSSISVASTSSGSSASVASGGNLSFSHTPGTGSNRLLLVAVSVGNTGVSDEAAPGVVTGVTFGGTAMTLVSSSYSGVAVRSYIYRLVNPSSASANVVVSIGTKTSGVIASATTFTGVNQTTPLGTGVSFVGDGVSYSISGNVSSAIGELVFSTMAIDEYVGVQQGITVPGDQTSLWNNSGFDWVSGASSVKQGAASTTIGYSYLDYEDAAMTAVSIKPAAGNMPANPNITAALRYGSTTFATMTNPSYNSSTGLLTWSQNLGSEVSIPAGQAVSLVVTTAESGVTFRIDYDSQTKPSRVELPVTTFIDILSYAVYSAPYPGGSIITNAVGGATVYPRAVVTDPFGFNDITGLNITFTPPGTTVSANSVATSGCTRTYEYAVVTPATNGSYSLPATAKEGLENTVTDVQPLTFDLCSPTVGTPVFSLGASSSRCRGAGTVTYTATASNTTGINYSLDAASLAAGNTIVAATGAVTFVSGWTGTSTITASAAGCGGPVTASHTVTTTPYVGTPAFTLGATSIRCQGAGTVTYTATATNSTGITYSLDAASLAAGNTIVAATGAVTFASGWSGTSTITASAAGCNGPATATHIVTITPSVATPVFALGGSSTRCGLSGTYSATATNATEITYSLDATSLAAGCAINSVTGSVTFPSSYLGTTVITASADGCNGPKTATHTVTIGAGCPPVAMNDVATGSGGSPLAIDALANDYDLNNNINTSSLTVLTQPANGSAVVSGGQLVYLPNGSFAGTDNFTYRICDNTSPTPLCATATVTVTIDPNVYDPCTEATEKHIYYIPFPEQDARTALLASQNTGLTITNIRTIISLKMPYPGMIVTWDHWEDGYESDIGDPTQSTTKIWGDGNPYNGIAPGYSDDIIPAGGSIVFDNTMPANPRNSANIFYDGRDKIVSSGQITVTQTLGEPNTINVQCMKTNVSASIDFGESFTIPVGQNFPSQDFAYTALFIRASTNSTSVSIDKDNNGSFETTATLNEGESLLVNGGVMTGATVTSTAPVGVDLHFGGIDNYSSREVPVFPATWYSSTYYTPVPTTLSPDSAVVMLYNSLNRAITINWTSGAPASGSIALPAKTVVRFPLALSATAAYKFVNPTGESFTAIEIVDSYTPPSPPLPSGGNSGTTYDWAFNLISEDRLTTLSSVAWAPGSIDGTANGNPLWVTPAANTTIYVKYDGSVLSGGSLSPCGLRYDVSYTLNALNYKKIFDSDNDQSGVAVYTCDGTKMVMVYGEDPSVSSPALPNWDVGSTVQPLCGTKLIFANDDYAYTLTNQPVTISVLTNDAGFLATIDPSSLNTVGLLQPSNGTITINANGTILYTPNSGFQGTDVFEYTICSTPTVVCDQATVTVKIGSCPTPNSQNMITGQVYFDVNKDGLNNDGATGFTPGKVYLYLDGNCNSTIDANELADSVSVDSSGMYQFMAYPEKIVADDFDTAAGGNSCASGSDGNAAWLTNWVDAGEGGSTGYCVSPAQSAANTDAEIVMDGSFSNALRLDDNNVSATRQINMSGATYAFLSFSYRRAATTLTSGENVLVQVSPNGTTFTTIFTISGTGSTDAAYVNVYNQDITAYASATTYIRFLTNNNVDELDYVFIDDISVNYLKYPQCYITKLDAATIPANHYRSSASDQNAFSLSNGGSCSGPFDYGIAKNSVTVSGTLFNDANGLSDGLVNGTATGSPSGATVYAYLVNAAGLVTHKTTVNAATGAYSFTTADVLTSYTVRLSTTNVSVYSPDPAAANWPAGWTSTGDAYGSNNGAGTGIESGSANSAIAVTTGLVNVTGVNFGIQQVNAGPDRATCQFSSVAMAATTTPGTWTADPSNPGTATIVTPTSATTTISNFSASGTYSFLWTNNGISDVAQVVVTAKPNAGADRTTCIGTTATLTGTSPSTGTWTAQTGNPSGATLSSTSGGVATANFAAAAAGNYNFIYTAAGCSDTVRITVTPAVGVSGTQVDVLCYGNTTGSINITASGGTSPYNYDWADITGTNNPEDRTILPVGSYTVTVTDANLCTASTSFTLTQPATELLVSGTQVDVLCNGASTGSINLTATGGTTPYGFDWADVGGPNNSEDRTSLAAGTYTVTVTDASGCYDYISFTITQPEALAISSNPSNITECVGGTDQMSVSTTGGTGTLTYQWQSSANGNNGWANVSGATASTFTPSSAPAGTTYYRVLANSSGGTCTAVASANATATIVADPSISSQPSGGTICVGGSQNLSVTASGGTPSLTYQWQYNNGGTWANVVNSTPTGATYSGATGTTLTVSGISAAGSYQYRVLVSASGTGCDAVVSSTATVLVQIAPNMTSQAANGTVCTGGSTTLTGLACVGTSGGLTRQVWNGISGVLVSDLTGNANYPHNPNTTEFYTSSEGPVNIAENYGTRVQGFVVPTQSGTYKFVVYGDDYTDLYLSTTSDPANKTRIAYVPGWTNPNEINKYPEQTSVDITLTAGNYYYIELLQKEHGGGDSWGIYWQTPGSGTSVAVPASNLVSYTASCTAQTYQWQSSPNGSTWSNISGASSITYTTPALSTTTYYRIIGTTSGGCAGAGSATTVTVVADPSITTQPQNISECVDGTDQLSVAATNGTGTLTYQWQSSPNGSTWTNVSGATTTTYTPPSTSAGMTYYRVLVTASGNGCDVAASNAATVTVAADPTATASGATTICSGGTATLSSSVSGGTSTPTYQWQSSPDGTTWTNISGATSSSYTTAALTTTTQYRVLATYSASGCGVAVSNSQTVTVVAGPTATASGATTICTGGTAALSSSVSGGTGTPTYQWQSSPDGSAWTNISGATSSSYTTAALTTTTQYRVLATYSASGCGAAVSNSQTVTVVADPSISSQPSGGTICAGGLQNLSVTASGGTPGLTYQWQYNNGGTWANVANSTPAGATYTGNTTASLTVSGISGAGSYQYRVLVSASGTGCDAVVSSTATITVVAVPTAAASGATTICTGGTATLSSSVSGGTGTPIYQWQSSPDGTTWTNISGATSSSYTTAALTTTTQYRVLATYSASGCGVAVSNSQTVTVVAGPTATASGATTICTGGTAALSSSVSGGTGTPTYQWQSSPDGTTWTSISGATSSSYTTAALTATTQYRVLATYSASGCGAAVSNSQTITVVADPTATASGATTICSGGTAALSSSVSGGTGIPTYQWQSSPDGTTWTSISGATSASYTTTALTATTQYRVLATYSASGCGAAVSNSQTVTVVADPSISSQPSGGTICAGGSQNLSVTASGGTPSLTYQWQYNNGGTWTNVANSTPSGATYSGNTSASLTVSGISGAGSYQYRVLISASGTGCDAVVSSTATITVVAVPTATASGATTICTGGTAALSSSVSGGTGSPIYQWQSSLDGTTWTSISGATSSSYTTAALTATTQYRVLATYSVSGCGTAVSNSQTVTVVADPAISVQPASLSYCAGGSPTISVTATGGTPSLTYQWQYNNGLFGWGNVASLTPLTASYSGATTADLTVSGITLNGSYQYRVLISASGAGCGSVTSSTATLTQVSGPSATASGATTICAGGTATLSSSVSGGTGTPTYQWQSSPNGSTWSDISGATSTTYTTPALSSTTQYRVLATYSASGCGTAVSNSQTVTVNAAPVVTISGGTTICTGGTVSLSSSASGGTGTPTYQWQSSPDGSTWANISGANSSSYTTPAMTTTTQYRLLATYSAGGCGTVVSNSQTVTVVADPAISSQPTSGTICIGGSQTFTVTATGGTPSLTYQWQYFNGLLWTDVINLLPLGASYSGANTASLTVSGTLVAGTSQYRVIISASGTGCGSVTSNTVTMTVVAGPSISSQPSGGAICVGGSQTMSVTASGGTPSLTYQWQYNNGGTWANVANATPTGATYTGATGTSLTVSGISTTGSHQYRVLVAASGSGCGALTSSTATVTVAADPSISAQPADATFCVGGSQTLSVTANGGTPSLNYQWQYNNGGTWANVTSNAPAGASYSGATSATLTVSSVSVEGSFQYRVLVSASGNGCDAVVSSTATLTTNYCMSIGNYVWLDVVPDGLVGGLLEVGLPLVSLQLYKDANENGLLDPSELTPIKTTTTSLTGYYIFEELTEGYYWVSIPSVNFLVGGVLENLKVSKILTSTNTDNQTDDDNNSIQLGGLLGNVFSPRIHLENDSEPIDSGNRGTGNRGGTDEKRTANPANRTGEPQQTAGRPDGPPETETGTGNSMDANDDDNGDMTVDFAFTAAGGDEETSCFEIIATENGNDRIRKYASDGTAQTDFVASGTVDGPNNIVFGPDGNLYVAEAANNRIRRFKGATGSALEAAWQPVGSGIVVPNNGTLSAPYDVEFGPDGMMYVSSATSGKVSKFNPTTGVFISDVITGLSTPQGLAFSPDGGYLYVVANGSAEIRRYNAATGDYVDTPFNSADGLSSPKGITFGFDGYLYITDGGNNRVHKGNVANGSITTFVSTTSNLASPGKPVFTAEGNLLVATNGGIRVFNSSGSLTTTYAASGAVGLATRSCPGMTIGDLVWKDDDGDGQKDASETGITGVKVELYFDQNANGTFEPGTDYLVDTFLTTTGGAYEFSDLAAGGYFVRIAPENFGSGKILVDFTSSTGAASANSNTDNDDNGTDSATPATDGIISSVVTLSDAGNNTVDFGFVPTCFTVFAAENTANGVERLNSAGTSLGNFVATNLVNNPKGSIFGPDGNFYVVDGLNNRIMRYHGTTAAPLEASGQAANSGIFVPAGTLSSPALMAFGPDGNLYVASSGDNSVKKYNGTTGAFVSNFISSNLQAPRGLAFSPDGTKLLVASRTDGKIQSFNASTGAFIGTVFDSGDGLTTPECLAFNWQGYVFIGDSGSGKIIKGDIGTGDNVVFVNAGVGGLSTPTDLKFGPDRNLYVTDGSTIRRYEGATGGALSAFASGVSGAYGMDFKECVDCASLAITVSATPTTICTGGTTDLSSTASGGNGSYTYQWQSSANGTSWTNISGATNATHTSAALTANTYFRNLVTDAIGCKDTSAQVLITVVADPSISSQPTGATICAGGSHTMSVTAANGTPSLTYQWQYNNGGTWANATNATPTGATYTGATSASFTVSGVSVAGSHQYRVLVAASGNGCDVAVSNTATLTVNSDLSISAQPQNINECVSGTDQLSVTVANGTGSVTYQWQSSPNGSSWINVSGATAANYTPPSTSAGTTYYRVQIAASGNGCDGVTSASATVTVNADPVATVSTPANVVCTGGSLTLTTTSSGGSGTCTFQWQSSPNGTTWTDIPGANGSTYTTPNLTSQTRFRVIYSCTGSGCCN